MSYTTQTLCVTALVHTVKANLLVYSYTQSPSTLLWPKQTNMNLVALIRFCSYGFMQGRGDLAFVQTTI
jgi:hypothetical protein